jgi:hypothetical protein
MPLSEDWFRRIIKDLEAIEMKASTKLSEPDRTAPEWNDWKIPPGSFAYWMLDWMNRETGCMSYDNPIKGMIRDLWSVVDRSAKPEPQEWDGEGYPPVGCECEYRIGGGDTEWYPCKVKYVLAGDPDPDADGWRAVIWCPHLEKDQVAHLSRFQFRPIRTQEQIDRASLTETITASVRLGLNEQGISNMVWAAGWRKEE